MWNLHYMDDALVRIRISNNMCYRFVNIITKTPEVALILSRTFWEREKTLAAQLPSCLAAFNRGVHD